MAFNFFKKKAKAQEQKPAPEKTEKTGFPTQASFGSSHMVLVRPRITEKASLLSALNQYIFEVSEKATKPQIKKAVEETYEVKVAKVQIARTHSKNVRLGKTTGVKAGRKKAIVKVQAGQKIELMPR